MARLAWVLAIVTALVGGCAGGTASMSDTEERTPSSPGATVTEAGGGGY